MWRKNRDNCPGQIRPITLLNQNHARCGEISHLWFSCACIEPALTMGASHGKLSAAFSHVCLNVEPGWDQAKARFVCSPADRVSWWWAGTKPETSGLAPTQINELLPRPFVLGRNRFRNCLASSQLTQWRWKEPQTITSLPFDFLTKPAQQLAGLTLLHPAF